MTTPAWRDCDRCNYDLHVCPGCGENLPHGIDVCDVCREAGHTLTTDGSDFDAWLARVRRDAAREAEAERDEWRQTALDERAAALDALEQVKAREARIRAVRDVLDQAEASIDHHPAYTFSGQRTDPIVNGADIRRALDGDA